MEKNSKWRKVHLAKDNALLLRGNNPYGKIGVQIMKFILSLLKHKQELHLRNDIEVLFVSKLLFHKKSERVLYMDQVIHIGY